MSQWFRAGEKERETREKERDQDDAGYFRNQLLKWMTGTDKAASTRPLTRSVSERGRERSGGGEHGGDGGERQSSGRSEDEGWRQSTDGLQSVDRKHSPLPDDGVRRAIKKGMRPFFKYCDDYLPVNGKCSISMYVHGLF